MYQRTFASRPPAMMAPLIRLAPLLCASVVQKLYFHESRTVAAPVLVVRASLQLFTALRSLRLGIWSRSPCLPQAPSLPARQCRGRRPRWRPRALAAGPEPALGPRATLEGLAVAARAGHTRARAGQASPAAPRRSRTSLRCRRTSWRISTSCWALCAVPTGLLPALRALLVQTTSS